MKTVSTARSVHLIMAQWEKLSAHCSVSQRIHYNDILISLEQLQRMSSIIRKRTSNHAQIICSSPSSHFLRAQDPLSDLASYLMLVEKYGMAARDTRTECSDFIGPQAVGAGKTWIVTQHIFSEK